MGDLTSVAGADPFAVMTASGIIALQHERPRGSAQTAAPPVP
jgi:hypothetical protein